MSESKSKAKEYQPLWKRAAQTVSLNGPRWSAGESLRSGESVLEERLKSLTEDQQAWIGTERERYRNKIQKQAEQIRDLEARLGRYQAICPPIPEEPPQAPSGVIRNFEELRARWNEADYYRAKREAFRVAMEAGLAMIEFKRLAGIVTFEEEFRVGSENAWFASIGALADSNVEGAKAEASHRGVNVVSLYS